MFKQYMDAQLNLQIKDALMLLYINNTKSHNKRDPKKDGELGVKVTKP